jgi:hypothetical protein
VLPLGVAVPSIKAAIHDIETEFHATSILEDVVPYNNKLMIAIILHVFRNGLNIWNYKSEIQISDRISSSFPKQTVLQLAESLNINPFYHRLFLVLLGYLNETGYVALSPVNEGLNITTVETAYITPQDKYFRKVKKNSKKVSSGGVITINTLTFNEENAEALEPSDGARISNTLLFDEEDPEALASLILTRWPQARQSVVLMMDVGMRIHEVILRGEEAVDPVSLIFADGVTADTVYRDDAEVRLYNFMAQAAFNHILTEKGEGVLHVLEVGSGTGGTTGYLLERLDPNLTVYTYTDISRTFFPIAQQKFAGYNSFIQYKSLDIEKDPVEQGFEPNSQDIVVAANVIHATRSLKESLTNVLKLLKPGGVLVLLESLFGIKLLDIEFGLTKGYI